MKVVPEILGRQELADVRIYGLPHSILYGIVFDNETEANDVKEMLEELLREKTNAT